VNWRILVLEWRFVMTIDMLRDLVLRRPFEPFVINLSSGESHEVRHPECLAIGKTRVYVSYPEDDRLVICSMLHITSVEALQGTQ
jgi:hypothetical protein